MNRLSNLYWAIRILPAIALVASGSVATDEKRQFTVRDSIEMSYFGTVVESNPEHSHGDGTSSPDGQFLIKMTHRGILPEGVIEGSIWLFDTSDILRSIREPDSDIPTPDLLVRMSAATNGYTGDFIERGNILFQPMWSSDNRFLYFAGRDSQENRQLFRVDIQTRTIEALSYRNQDVMTYRLSHDSVAYLAGPSVNPDIEWASAGPDIPDSVIGTGTPLLPLLYPNFRGYANTEQFEFQAWIFHDGSTEPIVNSSTGESVIVSLTLSEVGSSASADGTHLLLTDELLADTNWPSDDSASRSEAASLISVKVTESLDQSPVLVATDDQTGESRVVFDPNPQLEDLAMGDVRVYEWQDSHGRAISGGLVTPPNFEPGKQYPLVIQTHGFHRDRFFRNGYSETANAGRALASRGIVVLQVEEPRPDSEPRWADLPKLSLDVYLSAIDALSEEGTIDPEKVGITGYSETGLFTAASITRAPDRFAAALIANSDPLTITGYYSYVDSPLHGVTEQLLGAAPYGQDLSTWTERSPSMSTDKISAPVLIFASDPWHLLGMWDLYAALRYQEKPVELHYIRTGRHNIKKPLHKLAHQEMLVDWFDFWLNSNEHADPEKIEQYRRWGELRGTPER